MKKFFLSILAIIVMVGCASAAGDMEGSGSGIEVRKVKRFTGIRQEGSVVVHYSQGRSISVKVKAPAERMKDVKTHVEGQTLVVSLGGNNVNVWSIFGSRRNDDRIEVYVTSPDLVGISLLGSGDFVCPGHLDTDNLSILLRGSGDITFNDIICDNISTELVGSGDINLKNVDALNSEVRLVGSGDIGIRQKNTKKTKINLMGSGDISMSFANCGAVDSELKGAGDISLSGTVKSFAKRSVGSGDYHTSRLSVRNGKR